MSKGILYVAASLNGHIARTDGDVSWLDACQTEDYGNKEFLSSVETVIRRGHVTRPIENTDSCLFVKLDIKLLIFWQFVC